MPNLTPSLKSKRRLLYIPHFGKDPLPEAPSISFPPLFELFKGKSSLSLGCFHYLDLCLFNICCIMHGVVLSRNGFWDFR